MSGGRWWIEAQGRPWGPYPAERLPQFRDEGRLAPQSRVAPTLEGPWSAAGDTAELEGLFPEGAAPSSTSPKGDETASEKGAADLETEAEAAAREPGEASPDAPTSRTLLVLTDAEGAELEAVAAALPAFGEALALRPGLWLLRGVTAAAPLRNALSRQLRGTAMLLVAEATVPGAAWFNLDGESDRALRRLWSG